MRQSVSELNPCSYPRVMRIVLVIGELATGGAEVQLVGLAKSLRIHGHDVRVITSCAEGRFTSDLMDSEVELVLIGSRSSRGLLALPRLGRLIRKVRPDWVYPFLLESCVRVSMVRWMFPGSRVAWGVRDSFDQPKHFSRLGRMGLPLARKMSYGVDLVISNSISGIDAYARNGFAMARSVVIPNGIDTDSFRPDPESGELFRQTHRLDSAVPVVGMIARDHPMKGHEDFLQMAGLLRVKGFLAQYAIIGRMTDRRRSQLDVHARTMGLGNSVSFIGEVPDPNSALNAMSVCVIPSRYGEGFSNVLAEAMAVQTPVVTTNVGDSAKIVGQHGWVVDPGDPAALARAVEDALSSKSSRPESTRDFVVANYSLERLYSRTLSAMVDHSDTD